MGLRKGTVAPKSQLYANAPALLYSPASGGLKASVSTSVNGTHVLEELVSNARLASDRWMHLAVVKHKQSLLVYVNGILDAKMTLTGTLVHNKYPLYIGGDPFTADSDTCQFGVYLDDFRAYSRALAPHELRAEASPALGGVDHSFVHLGCLDCSLRDELIKCPASRHICTSMELHTGGYQVARSLGWLRAGVHVWTYDAAGADSQST